MGGEIAKAMDPVGPILIRFFGVTMNKREKESYLRAKTRALNKLADGVTLSKSEDAALNGMWYFTITLPVDTINELVKMADKNGVKPSTLASAWIEKGIRQE